jgi:hypothetical protein
VISNIRVYRLEISIPAVSFLLSSSRAKPKNASTEAFEQTIRKNTEIELIGLWKEFLEKNGFELEGAESTVPPGLISFFMLPFPAFRFAPCRAKYGRRSAA